MAATIETRRRSPVIPVPSLRLTVPYQALERPTRIHHAPDYYVPDDNIQSKAQQLHPYGRGRSIHALLTAQLRVPTDPGD